MTDMEYDHVRLELAESGVSSVTSIKAREALFRNNLKNKASELNWRSAVKLGNCPFVIPSDSMDWVQNADSGTWRVHAEPDNVSN